MLVPQRNVELNIPVVSTHPGKPPSQPEMSPPLAPDPESLADQQGSRILNTTKNREINSSDVKKCMVLVPILGSLINPQWSSSTFFLSGCLLTALWKWI
jgi:hypothetical protein